jgi:hypothetical protein
MASSDSYLLVFLDDAPVYVNGKNQLTVYPSSSAMMSSTSVTVFEGSTEKVITVESLSFVMPRLSDEEQRKSIRVLVGNRLLSGKPISSNRVIVTFKPPFLSEIQNTAGAVVGNEQYSKVVVVGSNFGAVGTIIYDHIQVASSAITSWTDSEIRLSVLGLAGNITVVVGAYRTKRGYFDNFSPIVITSFEDYLPDPSGYRTDGRTDSSALFSEFSSKADYIAALDAGGSSYRNLSVAGKYFGSSESAILITVGGVECPILPNSLVQISTDFLSTEVIRSVSCQVPPGVGTYNIVKLYRGGRSNYVANTSYNIYLDYNPPEVTGVSRTRVSTAGGDVVTLTGRNFGFYSRAGVRFGGKKLVVDPVSYSHTSMQLTVPAGSGNKHDLVVTVNHQSFTVYATLQAAYSAGQDIAFAPTCFEYYAPNVTGLIFDSRRGLPTTGGKVTMHGSDFGLVGDLTASVVRRLRRRLHSIDDGIESVRLLLSPEYDESSYQALDFPVDVISGSQDLINLEIGMGQGANDLLVNVSGQVTLVPFSYALPNLTMIAPNHGPTSGGSNVTLFGSNFGLGDDFSIVMVSAASSYGHCDFSWTENDRGIAGDVLEYSHESVTIKAPSGQCDGPMNLTISVAGQISQPVEYSFDPPVIYNLTIKGVTLGTQCTRLSSAGCGLSTTGGYTMTISGANFGFTSQLIYFDEVALAYSKFSVKSDTLATMVVPAGAGIDIAVEVKVGKRKSLPEFFSYDPPFVTGITPNEFDAFSDLLQIYGNNFGSTVTDAGTINIKVGNATCNAVAVGATGYANMWQSTNRGSPYLWCSIGDTTVGSKSLEIHVAGQDSYFEVGSVALRAVCSSGYYGQAAWTVYTAEVLTNQGVTTSVECKLPCDPSASVCTGFYSKDMNNYRLEQKFQPTSSSCEEDWTCLINANIASVSKGNCSVLTRVNEYCAACPSGSTCDSYSSLYSVEPIADAGFWRFSMPNVAGACAAETTHASRPFCWDVEPCSPTLACKGNNECAKGYTG